MAVVPRPVTPQIGSKHLMASGTEFCSTIIALMTSNLLRELGISIVPYCPLGRGFFGGRAVLTSISADSLLVSHPRFSGKNLEKNKLLYLRLETLAKKHQCTTAQLALAWLLHQGDDVVPIPGTTKVENLDSNIGSLKVKLSEEDLIEIADAIPVEDVAGSRTYSFMESNDWKYADTPKAIN